MRAKYAAVLYVNNQNLNIQVTRRTSWIGELAVFGLTSVVITRNYGRARWVRFAAGSLAALSIQQFALSLVMRQVRTKNLSLSDLISLSRATAADILAGLTMASIRDREGVAGRI